MSEIQLRPYQRAVFDAVEKTEKRGIKRQLSVLSTGLGKSYLTVFIILKKLKENKRTLILVDQEELVWQWKNYIHDVDSSINIGIEKAEYKAKKSDQVVIATVQSLGRKGVKRIKRFSPNHFQFCVIDEAHKSIAKTWFRVLDYFGFGKDNFTDGNLLYGTTATPFRSSGESLGLLFDDIIANYDLKFAISEGWLTDISLYDIQTNTDLSKFKNQGEFDDAVNNSDRNLQALKAYKEICNGEQALIYCASVDHAYELEKLFNANDVPSAVIEANTSKSERKDYLKDYKDKDIKCIFNYSTMTTGVDLPETSALMLLRPIQSKLLLCLDTETEILTDEGWKNYKNIKGTENVAQWNKKTKEIFYSPPVAKVVRPIHENEFFVKYNSRHHNLRVTDKHDLLYRNCTKGSPYYKKYAKELLKRKSEFKLPVSGYKKHKGVDLTEEEIKLIGWGITDGHFSLENPRLQISQSVHNSSYKKLVSVLEKGNFKHSVYVNNSYTQFNENGERHVFYIHKDSWFYLNKYFDRDISNHLKELNEQQFEWFLEAINDADGAKHESKSIYWTPRTKVIHSDRKEFVDNLQILCLERGYKSRIVEYENSYGTTVYNIYIKKTTEIHVGGQSYTDRDVLERDEPKDNELVWCVESENHTLITRRNGSVTIMGNTQITGRGLRPSSSAFIDVWTSREERLSALEMSKKPFCKVIDLHDKVGRHNFAHIPSLFGLHNELKSPKKKQFFKEVVEPIEKARKEHGIDPATIKDIGDIDLIVKNRKLEIKSLKLSPEVEQFTDRTWVDVGNGYEIIYGKENKALIIERDSAKGDLIDKEEWHLLEHDLKQDVTKRLQTFNSLSGAFKIADEYADSNKWSATFKKKAEWHDKGVTEAQMNLINKFFRYKTGHAKFDLLKERYSDTQLPIVYWKPTGERLNRQMASQIINQFFNSK